MPFFVVVIDAGDKRYPDALLAELKHLAAVELVKSVWMIRNGGLAAAIRERLNALLDQGQAITVLETQHGGWDQVLAARQASVSVTRRSTARAAGIVPASAADRPAP